MEHAAAGAKPMARLTFLLEEKVRRPMIRKDADLTRISALRARLKKQCSACFANARELAVEVLAALRVHASTRLAQQVEKVGPELWRHPLFVAKAFGADEQTIKYALSVRDVEYEFGFARDAQVVDASGKGQRLLRQEILGRRTHFAAFVECRILASNNLAQNQGTDSSEPLCIGGMFK